MMDKIRLWWKLLWLPSLTGKHYNLWEHRSWGDMIHTAEVDGIQLCEGHKRGIKVGDQLYVRMEYDRIARFVFEIVRYTTGSRDYFESKLAFIEFVSEPVPESK